MEQQQQPAIVWCRNELRLADNPALLAAVKSGRPVIPVLVWEVRAPTPWAVSGVAKAWFAHNAASLAASLHLDYGSRLIVRRGEAVTELRRLVAETNAAAVYCNATYDPVEAALLRRLGQTLAELGCEIRQLVGNLLIEPARLVTGSGQPYKVFSPYYRQFLHSYQPSPPLPAPAQLSTPAAWPESAELQSIMDSLPAQHVAPLKHWRAGEAAATDTLQAFINCGLIDYTANRDLLAPRATSAISPYLQCGAISVRQVWDEVAQAAQTFSSAGVASVAGFQRQLVWREFSHETLGRHPALADRPYKAAFAAFAWENSADRLAAWCRGLTGYPMVDAAMRQLYLEGWMPGRARMITASFLVKHLLQDWVAGERWFWERLIDADLACNAFNWQWVAGCGLDAAPYFRIFNPITQGQKFDPHGTYVRKYIPELALLPTRYIHSPWSAPAAVLAECAINLGQQYPQPIVEHSEARQRALAGYRSIR